MKKNLEVLHSKHHPAHLPLFPTVTTALAFDRWPVPQWIQGIVYFLLFLVWCTAIYHILNDVPVFIRNGQLTTKDKQD